MVKMNFSYLNKDELAAQLYTGGSNREIESMQNNLRNEKMKTKTRVSSAATRNSFASKHNQFSLNSNVSFFRQAFNQTNVDSMNNDGKLNNRDVIVN